ncbi:ABC transporter permease [Parafrankia sp. EUN1f]|uniref:ABC transporter permease n=1 Tax=Parafrankia sp. EUN1f TaxID=102897 RepID=UPI0018DD4B3E|nr:hypothetical protein [Parafrankia sp. EUN1f]
MIHARPGDQQRHLPRAYQLRLRDLVRHPTAGVPSRACRGRALVRLAQTPYGRSLYAIGESPRAARLVGISVRAYPLLAFAGAGLVARAAGVVLAARAAGATADNGTTMLFPALAAVFLGATAIRPGRFNVFGTVFGVALVAVSVSGLTLAGAADWVNPVFNGAALAVAVGLSTLLRRQAGRGGD